MTNSSKFTWPEITFDGSLSSNLSQNLSSVTGLEANRPINTTANASLFPQSVFPPTSKQFGDINGNDVLGERIETARIIIYSSIIIIAFFGNGLLVLTMTLTKKMRTTTNYFLLNMAVGDLLVATVCAPYQLASWKFPTIKTFDRRICKSMPFIQLSTVGISIYTMVAVAFVRYRAVISPLHSHFSKRASTIIIAIVWVASIFTAAPMVIVYDVKEEAKNNVTFKLCGEYSWADPEKDAATYTYVLFCLEYALPGLVTGLLYLRIILNLWYRNIPGMQNMSKKACQRFRNKHYRRKKTVIMLLAIFLMFMVCNLPMHVLSFIHYVMGPRFNAPSYMPVITTSAEMLMYGNSAVNPVLYGFLHNKFSASAKALLKWIFCGQKRPNYDRIISNKKEKQMTLNSGASNSSVQKREENKNAETKL